jgi:hypothetical protein
MPQLIIESYINNPEGIKDLLSWVFENIDSYIQGRILEISTDSFSVSSFIYQKYPELDSIDNNNRDFYQPGANQWRAKTGKSIDVSDPNFESIYTNRINVYDTVIAINALVQGFYQKTELDNMQKLLKEGGNLIAVFPANTATIPGLDLDTEYLKKQNSKFLQEDFKGNRILFTRIFYLKKNWGCFPFSDMNLAVLAVIQKTLHRI